MIDRPLSDTGARGVIFDLDGTLADTMPLHYEAWRTMCRRYDLVLTEDRFYALGGRPTKEVTKLVVGEAGLDLDVAKLSAEKEELFIELLDRVTPIEPIVDVARDLRGRVPLAVATGADGIIGRRILDYLGIRDWFTAIVTSDDVKHHKPDPEIFLESARRMGVPAAECLVYEDADLGLEAARRAGMRSFDVRTIYKPRRVTAAAG
jgi:beta-phosphoglucomutase family hydrolase